MSWFKFRNLSVIVICVIKSLIHSLQSKYTRVPGLRKLVLLAPLCNFTHHHCNCCIVKVNLPAATSGPSKKEMKITNLTSVVKKEEGSLVENLAGAEVPRAQRTCATALGSHQDRLVNRLFTFPRRSQLDLDTTISLPAKLSEFYWIII